MTFAHVASGSPVMLIATKMYGVDTVLLGLMGGALGVVVGGRRAAGSAPPDHPEYVVVDIPGRSGGHTFHVEGRDKWVHVSLRDAIVQTEKHATRISTPLILRWNISIVESHGLTLGAALVNLCTKSGMCPSGFWAWPTWRPYE